MSDRSRLGSALLLSLLAHAALLLLLGQGPSDGRDLAESVPMLDVDLVELPPPRRAAPPPAPDAARAEAPPAAARPESRIVPMPEAGKEMPSEEARFLSDRDNVVEQETVRRGQSPDKAGQDEPGETDLALAAAKPAAEEPPSPPEPEPPPPAQAEPPAPKPAAPAPRAPAPRAAVPPAPKPPASGEPAPGAGERAPAPAPRDLSLSDLLPRPGDIAMADRERGDRGAATGSGAAAAADEGADGSDARRDLLPRRRVQFSGGSGIATLLPSVRDGDVTLLNTKAHQFAPFVRRVAVRIFQHLQIALLEAARRGAAGSGREVAVVRATMGTDGRFLRSQLRESHSETRLSVPRLLYGLIGPKTFFDQNPPPGAVSGDGDIHFDLTVDLRVWSDGGATRGTPLTQFEGVLGVSLLE